MVNDGFLKLVRKVLGGHGGGGGWIEDNHKEEDRLGLHGLMEEINQRRDECDRLTRELEEQRLHFKAELEYMGGLLREEVGR